MTRQDFEERTNLQVKEEDFDAIHEVYMTTDHDKDQFCDVMKQAMRNLGGFEYIRDLGIALAEQRRKAREQQDRLLAKVNELTDFIFDQSYDADETELSNKARELLGEREYLARCLENEVELRAEDIDTIKEILRNY